MYKDIWESSRDGYLLIKQFLREYIRNVDWVHGGGCHSSRDRLFVQCSFVRRRKCDGEIVRDNAYGKSREGNGERDNSGTEKAEISNEE